MCALTRKEADFGVCMRVPHRVAKSAISLAVTAGRTAMPTQTGRSTAAEESQAAKTRRHRASSVAAPTTPTAAKQNLRARRTPTIALTLLTTVLVLQIVSADNRVREQHLQTPRIVIGVEPLIR